MKIILKALIITFTTIAGANELTLQCKDESGTLMQPVVINLKTKIMTWGGFTLYDVVSLSEKHITLREKRSNDQVGGEYWVIDRYDGSFKRASVEVFTDRNGNNPKLDSWAQSGRCTQQKF